MKNKLLEMRTYRAGLIQTTEQLHFSYIAILEGANMVAPAAYSAAYYSMGKHLGRTQFFFRIRLVLRYIAFVYVLNFEKFVNSIKHLYKRDCFL